MSRPDPGEPLQHMSADQRETYAKRMCAMASKARGRLAQHLRDAADLARGEQFYPAGFGR